MVDRIVDLFDFLVRNKGEEQTFERGVESRGETRRR